MVRGLIESPDATKRLERFRRNNEDLMISGSQMFRHRLNSKSAGLLKRDFSVFSLGWGYRWEAKLCISVVDAAGATLCYFRYCFDIF